MKTGLRTLAALMCFSGGVLWAQSGTVNSLSVNPRQNADMTDSTGTESGQPTADVPGSANQPNGLIPVTSDMVGSGRNANVNQNVAANKPTATSNANKPATPATPSMPATQHGRARTNANTNATAQK